MIDGFVVRNATTVLIIVMTFPNGLWVEDSTLIALALVTEMALAPSRMKMPLLLPSSVPVVLRGCCRVLRFWFISPKRVTMY